MDTKLSLGDHDKDTRGLPIPIYGIDEIIQRALIRLSVKKGSFPYDKALGSELYRLCGQSGEQSERTALGYVREALAPLAAYLTVQSVRLQSPEPDTLNVAVEIRAADKNYILEVIGA